MMLQQSFVVVVVALAFVALHSHKIGAVPQSYPPPPSTQGRILSLNDSWAKRLTNTAQLRQGLQAFWHFQEPTGQPRVDSVHGYALHDNSSVPVARVEVPGAPFGPYALHVDSGQRMRAARSTVPAITDGIGGPHAQVTLVSWVRLQGGAHGGMFVAGVWREDRGWRQYALFMNHTASCEAPNGVVAHISATGIPENHRQYCESAACGSSTLDVGVWHCIISTYNGTQIRAYVNGTLDDKGPHRMSGRNPFAYPDPANGFPTGGIFTPPKGEGADFAVGANYVHQGGGIGPAHLSNTFAGDIGGIAVYDFAFSEDQARDMCQQ